MDFFLYNFFPPYIWEKEEEEFLDLHQGNMFVNQYAACFVQLSRFTPTLVASESQKAQKFLKGLSADIFDSIAILKLSSYIEALEHAHAAEISF